jgi:UDP-4-amino-4,6-dideoxy-N-acetyl-beta-L-altrosamine transaminase
MSDKITQGSLVGKFEGGLMKLSETKYAVAVSSGTAALHAAVFAAGIAKGDEVITTPLSFSATANCVLYQGGTPVFADIDYETGLLDPKEVEKKVTRKTKAVITVDYAGHPSYFSELRKICRRHKLILIDDACHSFGASYQGHPIGTQADISVFSFHPAKVITTGEGGAVVTNNKKFYERALIFRSHGITKDRHAFLDKKQKNAPWFYEMQELGYNYRLCDIQCALGISQLKKLGAFLKKRGEIARYYNDELAHDPRFKTPKELFGHRSAWHLYPLRILDKKINKRALFNKFRNNNIFPQVHFIPIHTHPYYQNRFSYKMGDFPKAERFYEEEISLPMYPTLAKKDIRRVIDVLKYK